MDDFEVKLKKILQKEVIKPHKFELSIKTAFTTEKSKSKKINFKKILVPICSLLMLCTITFATSNLIYEKIWKEPKKMTIEEIADELQQKADSNKNIETLTEEQIKTKSLQYFKSLGYSNTIIEEIKLETLSTGKFYTIKSNGDNHFIMSINAENGEIQGLTNLDIDYSNIEKISADIAKENALNICNSLLLDLNNFDIRYCNEDDFYFKNQGVKMWIINFNKKYNEVYNPYDAIRITLCKQNGKINIQSIVVDKDNSFKDNPIIITKEQAEEIAKKNEEHFSYLEITEIETELAIRKTNSFIYELEKYNLDKTLADSNETDTYYKTDSITRNVWIVKIKHNLPTNLYFENSFEYNKQTDKKYFIDATTGEIIGGETGFENIGSQFYN